jgi:hypothetical protein
MDSLVNPNIAKNGMPDDGPGGPLPAYNDTGKYCRPEEARQGRHPAMAVIRQCLICND